MFFAMPMQMAAEREIHRHFRGLVSCFSCMPGWFVCKACGAHARPPVPHQAGLGSDNITWSFAYKPFAHPALSASSFVGQFVGAFIFAAAMFNFVLTVRARFPSSPFHTVLL